MILVVHNLTEDIEEENAHIFMQILVIEEEFGEECQILTVDGIFVAINFEHGEFFLFVPVDLVTRRVGEGADFRVPLELGVEGEEAEAEIADVEAVEAVVVDGVGAEVPGISGVFAHLYAQDGLELGDFLMGEQFGVVHAEVDIVVGVDIGGDLLMEGTLLDLEGGGLDTGVGDPIVVAFVEVLEVDIVAVGVLVPGFGGVIIYN